MVLRESLSYGSCYIIGIVPLIYNYYYSHNNVNLTASYKQYTMDVGETVAERFLGIFVRSELWNGTFIVL